MQRTPMLDGAADGRPDFWGLEGPEYLTWLAEEPGDHTVLTGAGTYPGLQLVEYIPTVLAGRPEADQGT